jgi:RimJ/RimL family protein N-acetyltransferase
MRLTALTKADLPHISRWQHDGEFLRLYDARPAHPQSSDALESWLKERQEDKAAYLFALRLLQSDELVGYIELEGILWTHRVGWLSIAIGDRKNWGQGYGTEAMKLALRFAFAELNLYRVQLTTFSYNQRAIALYQRLGFRHEGTFREFLQRDGKRYDMYLYGLLKREWDSTSLPQEASEP